MSEQDTNAIFFGTLPYHEVDSNGNTVEPEPEEESVARRTAQLESLLVEMSTQVRQTITQAVRALLGQAKSAGLTSEEIKTGAVSVKLLADVLRNSAVLIGSIHELARSEIQLSTGVPSVVQAVAGAVASLKDLEALSHVKDLTVYEVVTHLDKAAQVVEKSEEVLDLVSALSNLEIGVGNMPLSREDFVRLTSPVKPVT